MMNSTDTKSGAARIVSSNADPMHLSQELFINAWIEDIESFILSINAMSQQLFDKRTLRQPEPTSSARPCNATKVQVRV
jgi:hypothetical protein